MATHAPESNVWTAARRWIVEAGLGITATGAGQSTHVEIFEVIDHAYPGGWKAFAADHPGGAA